MTLETIQQLLPCVKNDNPAFTPCDNLRRLLAQQVGLIDQRIESLSQSRTILAGFLSSVN
jgi:DNA-binding transcriptional MerR regulator